MTQSGENCNDLWPLHVYYALNVSKSVQFIRGFREKLQFCDVQAKKSAWQSEISSEILFK